MNQPVCLVAGVGDATGTAIVRRYARAGYRVAMIARNQERLRKLEDEFDGSKGFVCDLADIDHLHFTCEQIQKQMGNIEVLVFNAVSHTFGRFMDANPAELERNFRVNTTSLLHLCRILTPEMIEQQQGSVIVTGNTASLRGIPEYALFAPTKAAQRILCQSLARELGPKKVHVGYVTIDGAIKVNWIEAAGDSTPDWLKPPENWPWPDEAFYVAPDAIADEVFHMSSQHESAWSFETTIRPFAEKW